MSYSRKKRWVKRKLGNLDYSVWRTMDWLCRKALFLGRDTSMDWIGQDGIVVSELLAHRIQTHHERFHGKSRREYWMDRILRKLCLSHPFAPVRRWFRSRLDWYLFFKAREIEWNTHHYIHRKGTDHIDGYFSYTVWGIKGTRTFDLCGLTGLKQDGDRGFLDLNQHGKWGFPTILLLKNKVMPRDIEKVLHEWYSDQVEYKYRHWTHRGARPVIKVADLKFMEDLCQGCFHDKDAHAKSCKEQA